ncbi:MAG: T9SS type A sorting domain-containing protein [Saprospiraceae bacterium]
MKSILFFASLLFLFNSLQAQTCDYVKEKYGFRVEKGIFVGIEPDFQGKPDSLFLDLYYPNGSTEAKRPLVVWIFGGGFIAGKREDFASICTAYAKRGFVAATIDYRIGFQGIQILPVDSAEIIRAGYRGAQDGKSALRFLKARHDQDSTDLERVWIGGASAGSIVAMATAFFNKESEKPIEAGNIGPANGNARLDLGPIEGNSNLNGYDTKVQGIFNIFGAVLNLNVVEPGDNIAVFSYHQTEDPVVACGRKRPYWPYAVVTDLYPIAYGTCVLDPRLSEIGLSPAYHKAWIYNGNQHAIHNETEVINYLLQNANPILCNTVGVVDHSASELDNVLVYPNPVVDQLILENIDEETHYYIDNINGNKILQGKLNQNSHLSTSEFNSGIYFLHLSKGSHTRTIKFIKTI